MACASWRNEIDAYVDGALSREQSREFEAHLGNCSSCSADALARMQWKHAVQFAGRRFTPSPEFRRRMVDSLAAQPEPRRYWTRNWMWLAGWAAGAIAVVLLILAGYRGRASQPSPLLGEAADLHVSTIASSAPLDVLSSDQHTVKPWFAGKLPFTFQLPALEGSAFTLLGGRVVYLAHSPCAQLLFQVRKHRISLFILQNQPKSGRGLSPAEAAARQEQFSIDTWSGGGLRYILITDASLDDLRQLSHLLKAAGDGS